MRSWQTETEVGRDALSTVHTLWTTDRYNDSPPYDVSVKFNTNSGKEK